MPGAGPVPEERTGEDAVIHDTEGALDASDDLADLLDRVLSAGVIVDAELALCVADIELTRISARVLAATACSLAGTTSRPGPTPYRGPCE